MRRLLLGLLGLLLLTATIPVTGEGPVRSESLDASGISGYEPASAQQGGTMDETNRTLAPEFPFAVQGLHDGSHLWVGKGSVGRSMGEQIMWASPVPGGPPGPVNDPVLEVQDDRVHVLNGAGIHVYDVATGEALERFAMLEDGYPSGGFPLANEQGNVSVIHGQSFVEIHRPETSATLWEPPTYTRAVPLDIDGDGEESLAALSSDDWPNDEWWIRALSVDGTEHWNTTVDAFARGFPCLAEGQLDEDPAEEIMLAVGATTAAAVDDDGSILWRVEGHGYQNTLHCTAGDVTGDGLDDLVVASFDPYDRGAATIAVHEGTDGSIRWSAPTHKGASYLTLTDVDGDGIDDVIGATYGFSNPGFTFTKPGWTGGVRSNHLVAFDGDAEVAPDVHWRRTFAPNRGYMSSGAADLEVLEHPEGDRLGLPLREAGGLLLVDPSTGDTLGELAGSHRAQTATWLGDTGLVGGQDGNIWHTDPTGTGSRVWAEVPGVGSAPGRGRRARKLAGGQSARGRAGRRPAAPVGLEPVALRFRGSPDCSAQHRGWSLGAGGDRGSHRR